jgi:predicted permease
MIPILTITLPIFVVILAGYLSAWRGLIDGPGIRGLTGFVFYFALPLTLFHIFATAPVAEGFNGTFVLVYFAVGLIVHLTGLFVAKWLFGCTWPEQAIQGIAVSFGNTVFIALPITTGLFGEAASLPLLMAVIVENGVLMPFTIALLEIERAGRGAVLQATKVALGAILRSPIVVSVLLGAGAVLLGIEVPAILDGIMKLVRGATVPCALFALGATLAGLPLTERLRETGFMVTMKLVAYPAAVYLAMLLLLPELDPVWRAVAVISAAVPIGANVYLIADRYQAYVQRASTAILASTVLSVVTVSALVATLG